MLIYENEILKNVATDNFPESFFSKRNIDIKRRASKSAHDCFPSVYEKMPFYACIMYKIATKPCMLVNK